MWHGWLESINTYHKIKLLLSIGEEYLPVVAPTFIIQKEWDFFKPSKFMGIITRRWFASLTLQSQNSRNFGILIWSIPCKRNTVGIDFSTFCAKWRPHYRRDIAESIYESVHWSLSSVLTVLVLGFTGNAELVTPKWNMGLPPDVFTVLHLTLTNDGMTRRSVLRHDPRVIRR